MTEQQTEQKPAEELKSEGQELARIEPKQIIEDAEETYFLESFDEALFQTLYKPKKELIKLIYDNMGGKRLSDKISDSIFNLINSISYEQAIDKIKRAESKDSKSGIITTAKELKSLDIIKTIVAMTSKINNKEINLLIIDVQGHEFNVINSINFENQNFLDKYNFNRIWTTRS